jgi:hypothetical protein
MHIPREVLKIIMTYKRDMDLLSDIPTFTFSQKTLKHLLLQQYTLLFTELGYHLDDYIRLIELPIKIFHDYQKMLRISRERYALWGLPFESSIAHIKWKETLSQFFSELNNKNATL